MWKKLAGAFTTGSAYRVLPPRVETSILRQQDASEILISVIQLAVVGIFGGLYAISPKTFPPEVEFTPVPWVLGAYVAFTLARLYISCKGRLPDWLVMVSVVADISMLLAMIWSFHLQYMQPASFFLKAPTVLYIFIFVALRTLRFEIRYILIAGGAAALGWVIMAVYVMTIVPGDTMITRNYVTYLTSNSILIGAEVDKIIAILVVTAILAMATSRARALLVQSVAETTAARDLARFFSPEIAREITSSADRVTAGRGVERDAAVLYLDLRGFTDLASRSTPNELIGFLTEYQRRMVPVIQKHNGCVDKFLGDGIMATFGAALANDTYAADALRAIDAMVGEAEAWNGDLRAAGKAEASINWAVAAGPVVFGAVGDESRLEYTVIGDAANLAAKPEKHNKAEASLALTTAETFSLALAQGYQPPARRGELAGRRVQGVEKPENLVVLAT